MFFICFIIVFLVDNIVCDNGTLLSVVQIFRHGQRNPLLFYPTDPYIHPSYGLKPGELTENGKMQLHQLGQYFSERYKKFLSKIYFKKDVLMKTSKSSRTHQSAEIFLSALFPGQKITIENTSTPILGVFIQCLRYDILLTHLFTIDDYTKHVNERNKDFYKHLRKHTKLPVYGILGALVVWDTLEAEHALNLSLPEWTNLVYPEAFQKITSNVSYAICNYKEMQRLANGPLLNEIVNHFEKMLRNPSSSRKIRFYSGHDINLICLLTILSDNFLSLWPPFASSLILELRRKEEKDIVNVYYKPEQDVYPVIVRGCGFDCEFSHFKRIINDLIIDEMQWIVSCFTQL